MMDFPVRLVRDEDIIVKYIVLSGLSCSFF